MLTNLSLSRACPWWIVSILGLGGCATASPDRLDDTSMTCTPVTQLYQLTAVDPAMRVAKQIDLDGDGTTDDGLGRAHDMIAGLEPTFAVAPRFPARLESDIPW